MTSTYADELLEKIEQQGGYSATYSQLSAAKPAGKDADDDVLKDVPDVEVYFGQSLAQAPRAISTLAKPSRTFLGQLDHDAQLVVARCFQKIGFAL